MNPQTVRSIQQALSAALDPDHVLNDESVLSKAVKKALALTMLSDDFTGLLNDQFAAVLERSGLKQFNEEEYMVAIGSLGLSTEGGIIANLIGPGVGPSEALTIEVK